MIVTPRTPLDEDGTFGPPERLPGAPEIHASVTPNVVEAPLSPKGIATAG